MLHYEIILTHNNPNGFFPWFVKEHSIQFVCNIYIYIYICIHLQSKINYNDVYAIKILEKEGKTLENYSSLPPKINNKHKHVT